MWAFLRHANFSALFSLHCDNWNAFQVKIIFMNKPGFQTYESLDGILFLPLFILRNIPVMQIGLLIMMPAMRIHLTAKANCH